MADRIVADGYRELGYKYVCIDDCWLANERDNKTGKLQADPERFPNGIKALSDYVSYKFWVHFLYGYFHDMFYSLLSIRFPCMVP